MVFPDVIKDLKTIIENNFQASGHTEKQIDDIVETIFNLFDNNFELH